LRRAKTLSLAAFCRRLVLFGARLPNNGAWRTASGPKSLVFRLFCLACFLLMDIQTYCIGEAHEHNVL
jgi:hypothetical protein